MTRPLRPGVDPLKPGTNRYRLAVALYERGPCFTDESRALLGLSRDGDANALYHLSQAGLAASYRVGKRHARDLTARGGAALEAIAPPGLGPRSAPGWGVAKPRAKKIPRTDALRMFARHATEPTKDIAADYGCTRRALWQAWKRLGLSAREQEHRKARRDRAQRLRSESVSYGILVLLQDGGEWTVRELAETITDEGERPSTRKAYATLCWMRAHGLVVRVRILRPARWIATQAAMMQACP